MKTLFILLFLSSCCKTITTTNISPNLIRLQPIEVDCNDLTYGECIIKYDNALKKSNKDKETILKNYKNYIRD